MSAETDSSRVTDGSDRLTEYRSNTGAVRYFFCVRCGIHTRHQRRSNPSRYGVNIACLDDVGPFNLAGIPVLDGDRHPNDHGGPARIVGTLRFEPSS